MPTFKRNIGKIGYRTSHGLTEFELWSPRSHHEDEPITTFKSDNVVKVKKEINDFVTEHGLKGPLVIRYELGDIQKHLFEIVLGVFKNHVKWSRPRSIQHVKGKK